jgi:hypothetical protein
MDNKLVNWQAISAIIAAGAFAVSLISICIAIISYRKTNIFNEKSQLYQEYEYTSRLQLLN